MELLEEFFIEFFQKFLLKIPSKEIPFKRGTQKEIYEEI